MRCGPRARPPGALPALHALQLCRLIELHDAVDLAVRVRVVLTRVNVLALHVDGHDAEEAGFGAGEGDYAAAVSVAVELGFGDPAFLEALEDVPAEVLVVGAAGTVFGVEALFQIFSRCPARTVRSLVVVTGARCALTDPPPRQGTRRIEL